jgi:YVTN family beta-propeller protein
MVLHGKGARRVRTRAALPALMAVALVAGCGASGSRQSLGSPSHSAAVAAGAPAPATRPQPSAPRSERHSGNPRHPASPPVQALVTAETENRLLVVDLPSGRVVRRVALPPDPEDIAAVPGGGIVVITSGAAGKVTLLARNSLRAVRVFGGFATPHIAAISPDHEHAYVTDDARGTLTAIDLRTRRVTATIQVGPGAHHLSFDAPADRAWVALGQSATTIVVLDTSDLDRPRVIGRFDPGFPAHDVEFTADGRRIWISSAGSPEVSVFSASGRRLLFRVSVGAPPQHVAFDGRFAYVTSGYGGVIEQVDAASGRLLVRTALPYGSFELDARDGYVVSSSLLRGTLAIYHTNLRLVRVVQLAPVTREVAISAPS